MIKKMCQAAARFMDAIQQGVHSEFAMNFSDEFAVILLMVQKSQTTTWDVQNLVNNGINYQPQLVGEFTGFLNHQQYSVTIEGSQKSVLFCEAGSWTCVAFHS